LLGSLSDHGDGGIIFLWNTDELPRGYMVYHPRKQYSSQSLLWEPQIPWIKRCLVVQIWLLIDKISLGRMCVCVFVCEV
jgi:hypothetical protein